MTLALAWVLVLGMLPHVFAPPTNYITLRVESRDVCDALRREMLRTPSVDDGTLIVVQDCTEQRD